jgi:hypothetical protein
MINIKKQTVAESVSTIVTTTSDVVDPYDSMISLREAISYSQQLVGNQTISFDQTIFTSNISTIVLSKGTLNINNSNGTLTINGPEKNSGNTLTITGNGTSGIFNINTPATINNLSITNGRGSSGTSPNRLGGAIYSNTTLALNNISITNSTANFGNSVYQSGSTLTLDSVTLQDIGGSASAEIISISGNTLINTISSGNGGDTLTIRSKTGEKVEVVVSGNTTGNVTGAGVLIGSYVGIARLIGTEGNDVYNFINNTALITNSINGGNGTNTINYEGTNKAIFVNLGAGQATGVTPTTSTGAVTSIQNIIGGAGNDTLIGSSAANYIDGGAGNDTITGQIGNDVLVGGAGADSLNGNAGFDILIGGFLAFNNGVSAAGNAVSIMTRIAPIGNSSNFTSNITFLSTIDRFEPRLIGDVVGRRKIYYQTLLNDNATDSLTDIASSTAYTWFISTSGDTISSATTPNTRTFVNRTSRARSNRSL